MKEELDAFKVQMKTEMAEIRALLQTSSQPQVTPAINMSRITPILANVARKVMFWNKTPFGQECLDLLLELDPRWGAEVREYVNLNVLPKVQAIIKRKEAVKEA